MAVDQGYAAWLKAEELIEEVASPDAARWAAQGRTIRVSSPLATEAGAAAEGARQIAQMGRPFVEDVAIVAGHHADWVGRCIEGVSDDLDYDVAGELLIVIGAEELADNTTALTVLKRQA